MSDSIRRRSRRGSGDGTPQEEINATRETPAVTVRDPTGSPRGTGRAAGVAERPVVPSKPGNAGGGKGP